MIVVDLQIHREMAKLMSQKQQQFHAPLAAHTKPVMTDKMVETVKDWMDQSPISTLYRANEQDITQRLEEFSFAGMGNIPKQLEAIELMNAAVETIRRLRNGSPESKN